MVLIIAVPPLNPLETGTVILKSSVVTVLTLTDPFKSSGII